MLNAHVRDAIHRDHVRDFNYDYDEYERGVNQHDGCCDGCDANADYDYYDYYDAQCVLGVF